MKRTLPALILATTLFATARPAAAQGWGAWFDPTFPIMNGRNGPSLEYSTGLANWDTRPKSGPNAYPAAAKAKGRGGWRIRPSLPFTGKSRVQLLQRPHIREPLRPHVPPPRR